MDVNAGNNEGSTNIADIEAKHIRASRAEKGASNSSNSSPAGVDLKPFGEDGLTFGDILDVINPLQHIPVISTIYRNLRVMSYRRQRELQVAPCLADQLDSSLASQIQPYWRSLERTLAKVLLLRLVPPTKLQVLKCWLPKGQQLTIPKLPQRHHPALVSPSVFCPIDRPANLDQHAYPMPLHIYRPICRAQR